MIMMAASPVSLCLYITCDGAKLKLPRVTTSKRVAQLAKAFVKSVSGKPAYAGLEPQHVTFEINGTVIGEADVVGDVSIIASSRYQSRSRWRT